MIWFLVVVFAVNVVFMPTYRYWVHRWETTDQAVYTLTGWLSREWRIVPISRIQTIDTQRSALQRLAARLALTPDTCRVSSRTAIHSRLD